MEENVEPTQGPESAASTIPSGEVDSAPRVREVSSQSYSTPVTQHLQLIISR